MGKTKVDVFEIKKDPFDPADVPIKLRVALFTDVTNSNSLRRMLETDGLDGCLIRADLIAEIFVLLAAASRAATVTAHNKAATKSLHSEIVYSLSPSKNITESLRTFGISDETTNLLVATADDEKGSKMAKLVKNISGKSVPLGDLKDFSNYDLIKEVYHVKDPELNKGTITDAILARIVAKDYVA